MADLSIVAGATSVSIEVDLYILATGAAQTGLVYNSSGLTAAYAFPAAAPVSITLATLASNTAAYSSGGFFEKDATKSPGLYRLDIPNAALAAASGREVTITLTGYSGMATRHIKIALTAWDNQITPGAAGGMFIAGTNAPVTITGSGDALTLSSTGSNGNGLNVSGNGSGNGIKSVGGGTGTGILAQGGATSGDGIDAIAPTSGHGLYMSASGSSKHGITSSAGTNGNGLNLVGNGTGHGLKTVGGNTSGSGIQANGGTSGTGIYALGNGGGNGALFYAGSTGSGFGAVGGASSGDGITINGTSGHGINITGGTSGHGVLTVGGASNYHGIYSTSSSGAAGDGVRFESVATNGSGMTLIHHGTGYDLNATTTNSLAVAGGSAPTAAQVATAVWQDTTAGDFTVSASIGKSIMNGVALGTGLTINGYTGNTPQTGDAYARIGANGAGLTSVGITSNRKKGVTATLEFTMRSATTSNDTAGYTVAAIISKDGGSFASTTNSVTDIGNGYYQLVLTATEMTANNIALQFTATGAAHSDISFQTQP